MKLNNEFNLNNLDERKLSSVLFLSRFPIKDDESFYDYQDKIERLSKNVMDKVNEVGRDSDYFYMDLADADLTSLNNSFKKPKKVLSTEELINNSDLYIFTLNSGFLAFGKKYEDKRVMLDCKSYNYVFASSYEEAILFEVSIGANNDLIEINRFFNIPNLYYSQDLKAILEVVDGKIVAHELRNKLYDGKN